MATFELDHLLVWVDVGGPEAERLAAFGLTEGAPNTHPGQGTACRRFFFSKRLPGTGVGSRSGRSPG